MLGRIFKRKAAPAEADALPRSVEAALGGISVHIRPDGDEDKPRILLQWVGATATGWHHTTEETRKRLAEAFPELTAAQLDRAYRAVTGLVRATQAAQGHQTRKRGEWAAWKPARSITEQF